MMPWEPIPVTLTMSEFCWEGLWERVRAPKAEKEELEKRDPVADPFLIPLFPSPITLESLALYLIHLPLIFYIFLWV